MRAKPQPRDATARHAGHRGKAQGLPAVPGFGSFPPWTFCEISPRIRQAQLCSEMLNGGSITF